MTTCVTLWKHFTVNTTANVNASDLICYIRCMLRGTEQNGTVHCKMHSRYRCASRTVASCRLYFISHLFGDLYSLRIKKGSLRFPVVLRCPPRLLPEKGKYSKREREFECMYVSFNFVRDPWNNSLTFISNKCKTVVFNYSCIFDLFLFPFENCVFEFEL